MGSATPVSVLFVSVFSVRDGGGYGRRQQQLLEDQWEARDSLRERVSSAYYTIEASFTRSLSVIVFRTVYKWV